MKTLEVRLFDRFIGHLFLVDNDGAPEDWRFAYDPDYAADESPCALSVSLPIQAVEYEGAVVRNWFCNLLPEGSVRDSITTRLRLEPRDDFALLAAIGGECAGAVSVSDPEVLSPNQFGDGEDLETLLANTGIADSGNWALLATPHRLSLAGAQDKLAVVREPEGRLRLPRRGEPSTHILKPESRSIAGLRDLEAFGLSLAHAVGLNAARAQPILVAGHKALLVERYDRVRSGTTYHRLHQEDFCQALGYPGEMKYESQGGASLKRCATLIREQLVGPEALKGFLDWVAFNVILGNADAHAKNLALLNGPDGRRSLAPFYDLVPTIAYDKSQLDRTPALRLGMARSMDEICKEDLSAFAKNTGYAPRFVLPHIHKLAVAVESMVHTVSEDLKGKGSAGSRLTHAVNVVGENAKRIQRELG